MSSALASSLAYCRRLTRRSRSSFRFAFRLLPPPQRDAVHALYAFLRATDDLADEPGEPAAQRAALAHWRHRLDAALAGTDSHRVHPALRHAVRAFAVPPEYLHEVVRGCESDLGVVRIQAFDELRTYCHRVAGVVGLACVRIWGVRPGVGFDRTEPPAAAAGVAFQLTNVLRDLGEDLARDRVYLPADDCRRFDCPPEAWADPRAADRFRALLAFQAARARDFYRQGEPLAEMLAPAGRRMFTLMTRAYRGLLDRVERAGPRVLARRVRLHPLAKCGLAVRGWAARWTG